MRRHFVLRTRTYKVLDLRSCRVSQAQWTTNFCTSCVIERSRYRIRYTWIKNTVESLIYELSWLSGRSSDRVGTNEDSVSSCEIKSTCREYRCEDSTLAIPCAGCEISRTGRVRATPVVINFPITPLELTKIICIQAKGKIHSDLSNRAGNFLSRVLCEKTETKSGISSSALISRDSKRIMTDTGKQITQYLAYIFEWVVAVAASMKF